MLDYRRPKAIREDSPASDEKSPGSDFTNENAAAPQTIDSQASQSSDSSDSDHTNPHEEPSDADEPTFAPSPTPENHLSSISFGALARAQASLQSHPSSKKRKRPSSSSPLPHLALTTNDHTAEALERRAGKSDTRLHPRPSKHAPAELSSKKAVSRTRSVVPHPTRSPRDPRFESLLGPLNEQKIKSNYAFLEGYRDSEIRDLKRQIKTPKLPEEKKDALKKEVLRMESRRKAQERKDAEQEVVRRHRREEKAKVEGGKTPFYLKRGEIRREALVERYKGMKGKEVDRLVERRRRKKAGREKRNMPRVRRGM